MECIRLNEFRILRMRWKSDELIKLEGRLQENLKMEYLKFEELSGKLLWQGILFISMRKYGNSQS